MNRHRPRRINKIDPTAIRMGASIKGCRCQPDIKRRHRDGIAHIELHHDGWCPAVDAGSQMILRLNPHQPADQMVDLVAGLLAALGGGESLDGES